MQVLFGSCSVIMRTRNCKILKGLIRKTKEGTARTGIPLISNLRTLRSLKRVKDKLKSTTNNTASQSSQSSNSKSLTTVPKVVFGMRMGLCTKLVNNVDKKRLSFSTKLLIFLLMGYLRRMNPFMQTVHVCRSCKQC